MTASAAGRHGSLPGVRVGENPGGGFRTGAQVQEESIARASALHACLESVPEFYSFHRQQRDLRYSDRVIYCPAVPVFRDDKGRCSASHTPCRS